MKTFINETLIATIGTAQIVHVTDNNRKRPLDTYELRDVGGTVIGWAHANGTSFMVNAGHPDAPLSERRFIGIAPGREVAISALRKLAA